MTCRRTRTPAEDDGFLEPVRIEQDPPAENQPPAPAGTATAGASIGRQIGRGDGGREQMLLEFTGALVQAVELKDPYTRRHSEHVALYADQLAAHLGLARDDRESVRVAALLHDIGKIAVPDSILTKPGRLCRKEFALIRQHPEVGAGILENISMLRQEARLVRHHHEAWDGSGYPHGLRGERIPLGARILNICDSMDAMLMARTYKAPYPVKDMLAELRRCADTQFDPELARAAVDFCTRWPTRLILPRYDPKTRTA